MIKMAVSFADREAFGRACVALTAENVSFSPTGFQTIVFTEVDLSKLTTPLFGGAKIRVYPVSRSGKRPPLPTPQQAEDILIFKENS